MTPPPARAVAVLSGGPPLEIPANTKTRKTKLRNPQNLIVQRGFRVFGFRDFVLEMGSASCWRTGGLILACAFTRAARRLQKLRCPSSPVAYLRSRPSPSRARGRGRSPARRPGKPDRHAPAGLRRAFVPHLPGSSTPVCYRDECPQALQPGARPR